MSFINTLKAAVNVESFAHYPVKVYKISINWWGKLIAIMMYIIILPFLIPGIPGALLGSVVLCGFEKPKDAFRVFSRLFGFYN